MKAEAEDHLNERLNGLVLEGVRQNLLEEDWFIAMCIEKFGNNFKKWGCSNKQDIARVFKECLTKDSYMLNLDGAITPLRSDVDNGNFGQNIEFPILPG